MRSATLRLRIHAIILALNEEVFICNQLKTLYPFCSGISVLTQYDRDWYGTEVAPDQTLQRVAEFPDPEGKIHLIVRRWPDEASARNSEMLAHLCRPERGIMSHGSSLDRIRAFHAPPDYFLIVDADEFYDPSTLPQILDLLAVARPRGMRVHAYNYVKTWNRRVLPDVVRFCHFGFLEPGIVFTMRRTVSWNESRVSKFLKMCHVHDFSASLWGFIECPPEVGMFHHGCWLGGRERLIIKAAKSSHREMNYLGYFDDVSRIEYVPIQTSALPINLQPDSWPSEFFDA
ncbi:MAG: hypothetical protein ABJA98_10220 [Acidobacteriota bacterium]